MKQRTGFVSNSSSSSYIIALAPLSECKCPACGQEIHSKIMEVLRNKDGRFWSDETEVRSEDYEVCIDYLLNWSDQPKRTKELDALVNAGWRPVYASISHHDQEARDFVWEENDMGRLRVIYSGE